MMIDPIQQLEKRISECEFRIRQNRERLIQSVNVKGGKGEFGNPEFFIRQLAEWKARLRKTERRIREWEREFGIA